MKYEFGGGWSKLLECKFLIALSIESFLSMMTGDYMCLYVLPMLGSIMFYIQLIL